MKTHLNLGNRKIGPGEPVYIIAELSANHHQSYDKALEILHHAKEAGADALKLQTYTADTLTFRSDKEYFRVGGGTLWDGKTLHELYEEAYTPWEWQPKLQQEAQKLGLDLFSSGFDPSAIEFLEKMKVPVHKVASFEIVDLPLIEKMAKTGKPLIISTGMATLEEIDDAVQAAAKAGATEISLLKCTSAYPASPAEMFLKTIPDLRTKYQIPIGLSDHTLGIEVPVAAVALGASLIEKHLTLSRKEEGPDSAFSLEPAEFKAMVEAIRKVESALGEPHYGPSTHGSKSRLFRRSLFAIKNIKAGEIFSEENIRSIRPGHGLAPKFFTQILGKKASRDLEAGTPLAQEDLLG